MFKKSMCIVVICALSLGLISADYSSVVRMKEYEKKEFQEIGAQPIPYGGMAFLCFRAG
ncbi:MAG: hypothetical protein ACK5I7_06795 [Anaerotignum sp.]